METDAKLKSLDWNIQDAKEALTCAVGMGDWDGCIKYANQLKALEYQRVTLTAPIPFSTGQWVKSPSVNGANA